MGNPPLQEGAMRPKTNFTLTAPQVHRCAAVVLQDHLKLGDHGPRAVHCFKMPSLAKSPPTCDAFRRSASAMLVTPMVRSKPIVAFRKAAITSGPERLRIRLASSPIVTSRT